MHWLRAFLLLPMLSTAADCGEISLLGWNGNMGRRDVGDIAESVHDLYAIVDVRVSAIEAFVSTAKRENVHLQDRFEFLGEAGGLFMWNPRRLGAIEIIPPDNSRERFSLMFEDRESGARFWVVLVDFDRRQEVSRQSVEKLQEWVTQQDLPVLVVGTFGFEVDLNHFDQNPDSQPAQLAYSEMTCAGLQWVRPGRLAGLPAVVESLDYIAFASEQFRSWNANASLARLTADHPPVVVTFNTSGPVERTEGQ